MSPVDDFLSLEDTTPLITSTKAKLTASLTTLNELLSITSPSHIALSFNGGKDCLILLYLYLHSLSLNNHDPSHINTVLINYEPQFPELIDFINLCVDEFQLNLIQYELPLREGFEQYLSNNQQITHIIIGQRKSDPYSSNLQTFQKTDNNWPNFIRVHPLLDWHYDEVWCFIKNSQIQYCKLYDLGYTSIGGIHTTIRNPYLRLSNGEFKQAWELNGENSDELEREGRNYKK